VYFKAELTWRFGSLERFAERKAIDIK
jgi:hypothetical protein